MVRPISAATSIIVFIRNTVIADLYQTGVKEPRQRSVSIKLISRETKCGMDADTSVADSRR
jgi:hypothetical protein